MPQTIRLRLAVLAFGAAAFGGGALAQAPAAPDPGQTAYGASCAGCHGEALDGGDFSPPLRGDAFKTEWRGKTADDLFARVKSTMPPGAGGSLSDGAYHQIVAYILQVNGVLPTDKTPPGK